MATLVPNHANVSVSSRARVRRRKPSSSTNEHPAPTQSGFPRPHTLNKRADNGVFTLNNRPTPPRPHTTTPNGDPFHEVAFESTIPVFQSPENVVAFRDHVLRRIDLRACEWVVSRNHNDNEAVYSTRTKLLGTWDRVITERTDPVPFHLNGTDVIEKLIVHSVAILIVDIVRFSPEKHTLDIEGRLWVPPSNVQLDMNVLVGMYNDILHRRDDTGTPK
jgi:hypothetical protein